MAVFQSQLSTSTTEFAGNRDAMLALVKRTRQLEERAAAASAKSKGRFDKRGQILPRERLARLLDPGSPFLEIGNIAGYLRESDDPDTSVPGAAMITGIGFVSGVRSMIVVNDSGINAGAISEIG